MNLHNIAVGVISAVNPQQTAAIAVSTGATTSADGSRVPTYATTAGVSVQVQDLSSKDLQMLDGLNLQGQTKAFYINGDWQGVVRGDGRGGDIIILAGKNWLIVKVVESWVGWTKVIGCLQVP